MSEVAEWLAMSRALVAGIAPGYGAAGIALGVVVAGIARGYGVAGALAATATLT